MPDALGEFDSENRQILECRAETDVRRTGRLNAPSTSSPQQPNGGSALVVAEAKELVYDPLKDSVVLSGKATLRQDAGGSAESGSSSPGRRFRPRDRRGSLEGQAQETPKASAFVGREMQFSRASQEATFSRDVTLKYGGIALHADDLDAKFRDDALKGFEAKGGVVLDQAGGTGKTGRTLKADSLVCEVGADRKLRSFDASGRVLIQEPTGPTTSLGSSPRTGSSQRPTTAGNRSDTRARGTSSCGRKQDRRAKRAQSGRTKSPRNWIRKTSWRSSKPSAAR